MNEFSPLCLAVIIRALEDLGGRGKLNREALAFLNSEDDLFFFIDAGDLQLVISRIRREIDDPKTKRQCIQCLKRLLKAAL